DLDSQLDRGSENKLRKDLDRKSDKDSDQSGIDSVKGLSKRENNAAFLWAPKVNEMSVNEVTPAQKHSSRKVKYSRYIPSGIKREASRRAEGYCSFIDPVTKRRCSSRFKLEFHHIKPFAKGGSHTPENIALVCR